MVSRRAAIYRREERCVCAQCVACKQSHGERKDGAACFDRSLCVFPRKAGLLLMPCALRQNGRVRRPRRRPRCRLHPHTSQALQTPCLVATHAQACVSELPSLLLFSFPIGSKICKPLAECKAATVQGTPRRDEVTSTKSPRRSHLDEVTSMKSPC